LREERSRRDSIFLIDIFSASLPWKKKKGKKREGAATELSTFGWSVRKGARRIPDLVLGL